MSEKRLELVRKLTELSSMVEKRIAQMEAELSGLKEVQSFINELLKELIGQD